MKKKLKEISRNKFLRNVSTLAFGTILSQGIVVISSPLLSRLFSVEDFGVLSVFTSFSIFFAVLSTGRYELAVGLPSSNSRALKIIKLIICIGAFVSIVYLLLIFLLKSVFHVYDKTGFLVQKEAYLAPIYIFFIAVYSALGYWCQRKKNYKKITIANAVQVILTTICSILFGVVNFDSGMIWALIIGVIVSSLYLLFSEKNLLKDIIKQRNIKIVAKKYYSFPRYMIFSDLSLTASQQFIPILFSVLYSTTVVGFFSMANRMLRLPNIVITSSIANVFRNDAIDEIREKGNCEELYKSTFKKLLFMSLPCYLALFIISPYLFEIIFGEKWHDAGIFARIISIFLLVEFIATPLNTIFYIREKQKVLMRLQFLNALFGGVMIYLGFHFFSSPAVSLILFSLNSLIFNILFLFLSFKISKHV